MKRELAKWKVLSKETLVDDSPWLVLTRERVETESGAIMENYYVSHRPDFAIVVAWNDAMQLLVERQYRHGGKCISNEVPAGMIEEGEDPADGIRRELLEETGYEAKELRHLFDLSVNIACSDTFAHCYMATGLTKVAEQELEPTENLECFWMPYQEVLQTLHTGGFSQGFITAAIYRSLELLGKEENVNR